MLFFGSVKENIVLGAPYVDDSMVLKAAEIAGVTEFVNRHPQGFDMHVGERGEGLSGGQRQSVANARALLLDAPILVMDEPSNSLDNRSEENFKTRLTQHLTNHTLLLVTHRASLLTMVDRLIVMDGGQVIADGPKEQVMQALSGGKLHVAKN
jgi:ATP-binding cassette subfamily C protein LapB